MKTKMKADEPIDRLLKATLRGTQPQSSAACVDAESLAAWSDGTLAADEASARLVAGSLDAKDQWRGHPVPSVRCRARRTRAFDVAWADVAWADMAWVLGGPGTFSAVRRMTSASVPDGW